LPPPAESTLRRLWCTYVTDVRDDANARVRISARGDRDAAAVLVTAALCLTLSQYLAKRDGSGLVGPGSQFERLTGWALIASAAYVVLPMAVTVFVLRRPLRDIGLRASGVSSHWPVYALLYSLALPAIVIASFGDAFQTKYPFYDLGAGEAFWPRMFVWWSLYALQFVALEFFFRGFLVHGLAPRFGWVSIFVMIVPYNMLHYGKPMPEALVAIAGGIVLGTLSLKTRSIWWGAALHIAIAITMDSLALWHAGRLL
ncbi:MAG: lysostaphin resistance A-like protein, partial [Acidimicrobiia bacterium]